MRKKLAAEYISGKGIEIGGLNAPLSVPEGVIVTFVDLAPFEEIVKANPEVEVVAKPEIIDNAETLEKFDDASQDFVIANHVLEHMENPIKAFYNWMRVLKPGGVIYAAIPEKTHTFDRNRPVTRLTHIIEDWLCGPDRSLREHYVDWYMNSELEGVTGEELKRKVEASMASRNNIHFHVWDKLAIENMFKFFKANIPEIESYELFDNGAEVIAITRKKA